MKLYNSYKGLLLFTILFLLWAYTLGKSCPCDEDTKCTRYEFYGVQLNHFFLFLFLGYFFPSFFFTIQTMGILWELFEYYLDKNPYIVINHIGGCLMSPPKDYNHKDNSILNYVVYKGIKKPLNPIDKFFNIENSTIHAWHGSAAEIVPNILGFLFGYTLSSTFKKGWAKPIKGG